jgi:hypothetical protein
MAGGLSTGSCFRSGATWAEVSEHCGPSTTGYTRFVSWRKAGVWDRLLAAVSNSELGMIDFTCMRVHQHGATGKRMTRPVGKWRLDDGLISLQKPIRPFGSSPLAKMEIRASLS